MAQLMSDYVKRSYSIIGEVKLPSSPVAVTKCQNVHLLLETESTPLYTELEVYQ